MSTTHIPVVFRGQKKTSDPLGTGFRGWLSSVMQVMGTLPKSSTRAASVLNHRTMHLSGPLGDLSIKSDPLVTLVGSGATCSDHLHQFRAWLS